MGKTRATAGARGREPTTEHKTQTNKATMQALRTKPTKKTAAKAKPAKKPTGLPSFNFGAKKTSAKSTKTATKVSPFSFGSKPKQPAAKKSVAPTGPAAQSFEIRIPGQFFQARKDIVWNVSLGFTKSNELFVGRMAMLGFAAFPPGKGKFIPDAEESEERPKGALQDPTISILNPGKFLGISGVGFTKANELFVGRMAQLGFAASLIGEAITGKGPLAQFNMETGIPLSEAEPLLLFSIVLLGLTAVNEGTGKFVDEE